ncbi:MAG TPA: GGDEF domain-containing protein, partial [Acidimicrobiales bacterium]
FGAATGLLFAPVIARQPWRSTYSVTWTILSTYAVGLVAVLDGGISSPLMLLLFLPLVYGTLMFSRRAATVCGVSVMVTVAAVAVLDKHLAAAYNRAEVEEHERHLLAQLAELAGTDELTGCSVRRVLRQHMDAEIERSLRTGSALSLLMIDVDRFKSVNDEFGHVVGDRVLVSIGSILMANVRPFDVASRLGGDEFALLLPETDAKGAVLVAERICRELAGSSDVPVTLSIGVSSLDRSMPTAERLVDEADLALYQVKRSGRDAIAVRAPGSRLTR